MSTTASKLTESQSHALLSGFKYLDRLLSEGLNILSNEDSGAVFQPAIRDASPDQCARLKDEVAELRASMRRALRSLGVSIPPATDGGIWALRTHLNFVEVTLQELMPRHLRGYGQLDESTAAMVTAALAEVQIAVTRVDGQVAGWCERTPPTNAVDGNYDCASEAVLP